MFIFLSYFIVNMIIIGARVTIRNSGVMPIENDDTAMVFFVTLRNSCKRDVNVSVHMLKCIENSAESANTMLLIGGNMGIMKGRSLKNVTLIYPNLYLEGRSGQCTVEVCYQQGNFESQIKHDIEFDTSKVLSSSEKCNNNGLVQRSIRSPSIEDCVVKYSGKLNYYNREVRACRAVVKCPFDHIYMPISNTCRNVNSPVCQSDLETLESGVYPLCRSGAEIVNFMCHHGQLNNSSGECVCDDGWTTTSCSEGVYQPSLAVYHMCNIETSSWGKANKKKVAMTVIAIIIFALMLAAKMLIAVCILNWCCQWIRAKRNKNDDICDIYTCTEERFCGDERCSMSRSRLGSSPTPTETAETEENDDDDDDDDEEAIEARSVSSTGLELEQSSEPTTEQTSSRRQN